MEKQRVDLKNVALYVNPHNIDTHHKPYGTWKLGFVDITKGYDDLKFWDRYSYTGKRFRNLFFRAQWELNNKDVGVYGQRLILDMGFDSSIEHAGDLTPMVEILKKAEKAQYNFLIQPKTFGQFVALVCLNLGVKTFVYPSNEIRNETGWGTVDKYWQRQDKIGDYLVRMIDNKIEGTYLKTEEQKTA